MTGRTGSSDRRWVVREGTIADVASVLALWREAETAPSVTDDVAGVELLFATGPGSLLVVEIGDRIVASLIATFDGWRGNLYRLAVHPEYRRRGIVRTVLTAGEDRLRRRGACKITALVAHEQAGATAFWRAVGYRPDAHTTRHAKVLDSDESSTALR